MIDLASIQKDPRRRNLAVLGICAVVMSLLALWSLVEQANESAPHYRPETMFPQLVAHNNEVSQIRIVSKKGEVDLALKRAGWVMSNHDDYPVPYEQIHQTVVGIAALQTLQPMTARVDWLHYVGLDAPPHGDGVLITLTDDRGDELASLIAGKTEDIGDPSGAVGLFVRKPDATQSWLARSVFEPKSDPSDWFDKNVMGIDREKIQETDVNPASGPSYSVRRERPEDASFALTELPKGRAAADGAADGIAAAIVGFTFDDVRPARDFDFSDATHTTRVVTKTFDGLTVTIQVIQKGADYWATVSAEGAAGKPDAQKQAREIDAHAFGWAYKLPAYKAQQFMTSLESLLKPIGGAPAQSPPAQTPPVQ